MDAGGTPALRLLAVRFILDVTTTHRQCGQRYWQRTASLVIRLRSGCRGRSQWSFAALQNREYSGHNFLPAKEFRCAQEAC